MTNFHIYSVASMVLKSKLAIGDLYLWILLQDLERKVIGEKQLKVADVIPRSFEKKSNCDVGIQKENSGVDDAETNNDNLATDGSVSKKRSLREVVTPLAHLAYADQLEQKKSSLMQILKRLVSQNCFCFVIII